MAEPLKDIYNVDFLREFSEKIYSAYSAFDRSGFIFSVMNEAWEELALKARIRKIAKTLGQYLPRDYKEALEVLFSIDEECVGFPYLFFPDFVEVYGQEEEHWQLSMKALERFTQRSSSEFAIRPFLIRDSDRFMSQMRIWSKHPNEHVRRLSSEGCRPRLPWGIALPMFKKDPAPVITVLEQLKADPSLYVRKSVANNLNDIAKDNPSIVIETAGRWKNQHEYTDWILRQGCRNLIRKGNFDALEMFGYEKPIEGSSLVSSASLSMTPTILNIGESCQLQYELRVREGTPMRLRIEYGINFVKSRGKISQKLFLLSDKTVEGGAYLTGSRQHKWVDLTTRRHYPGVHEIVLLVNGAEVANTSLVLKSSEEE